MRWVVTLSATKVDAERLLAASIEDLAPHPTEASKVLLELQDSFGDESTDETRQALKQDIDLRVRHINGFGKLRWGRGFEGVEVEAVRSFDSTGAESQVAFVGAAHPLVMGAGNPQVARLEPGGKLGAAASGWGTVEHEARNAAPARRRRKGRTYHGALG